mgnify:CR=1 FL=1
MKPHLIGYWYSSKYNDAQKYPDPHLLETTESVDNHLVEYLNYGQACNFYRGSSSCRLCGIRLGSSELSDGEYIWPKGLDHYVSEHKIKLPDYFLEHVSGKSAIPESWLDRSKYVIVDESKWLDYYKEIIKKNIMEYVPSPMEAAYKKMSEEIRAEVDKEILIKISKKRGNTR